nr:helix-turn-helix transcriptional regulator [Clostridia bacterium]
MNTASIGKRIRKYREAKGWRQEDFAEKIGLSVTYTGMIERGEKVPKLETFITIANALEVSADMLLADVLTVGYNIKSSEITEEISALTASERERIYSVVEAMIRFEKNHG